MASGPSSGLTIVLLGNSGVGKSASGNTILGRKAFVSKRSFTSVTKEVSKETDSVFCKRITVVDTPGILGSEKEVTTLCQDLLKSKEPCLFLIVVKIDRFTDEQKNAVEAAIRVIGGEGFENCHLLFTSGDALKDKQLDDFINDDPESPLPTLVERFKGRYHVFNNKNGRLEQVRHLLEKSGHLSDVVSDPPGDPRRMVLLGLPGQGKSASGNTILGSIQFKSGCDFRGVSTEAVSKTATVEGRQVTVVDTPGFTDKDPEHLFREIVMSVEKAYPGPHAFIIVLRINRISEAEIMLFEMLPKLFGKGVRKHMMVLFTHGDGLKGKSIKNLIKAERSVSDLVTMCAGRYSVFDNTKRGNRVQVKHLLDKMDKMVTANNGKHFISERSTRVQMLSGGSERVSETTTTQFWLDLFKWFMEWLLKLLAVYNGMPMLAAMRQL
ncbi:GTPase IMAP family member 8-like [Trematomus bernacchii]|uniref:GTPase IMAP family member 8-like n=1 Tax=Trematomus bernacchii TaxID=40690 RepID=UPI00146D3AFF|nr:GTPase IMAP family member 8-like [Trematomus bernacchii]